MHCPRCRHENSGDNRFCEGCGHAFTHTCAACGRILGPAARFCGGCGNEVEAPGLATEADLAAPQDYLPGHIADRIRTSRGGLEGERKRVTVLFADIKGSLELIHGADPEEAQTLLDGAIRRMMEAVHRYEGTVNKVLGDGVMALFGAPIAHEDHAVRGCYAALAMQESIRRSADEVRRAHGVELLARVGINSGEVIVRGIGNDLTMDYDAIGETTHLAARMEQLAAPGTIRITGSVLELAEAFVQVRALGPIPVKGLERPVGAYELTGVTTLRTRFQASLARGLTAFVGRGTETDLLAVALRQAAGGEGRVVSIIGEPGVGKSRLFYEFIRSRATEGWLVLESGSVSYGRATAYMPVIDLLRCYFGIEGGDDSRRIRERVLGKLLTLDEDLRALATPILGLIDAAPEDPEWEALDAPQCRRQMLDAVRSLLLHESAVQPVLLLFEDLHWIDAETQAFLDSLVESLPKAPILLLVNYRPEYGHGWGSKPYYTQRRIDALPPASATDLLRKVLGADASLASLKDELITHTAGNPLFLEESVRALVEAGALRGSPGDYRLAVDTFSIEVPATVQSVLAARIGRLALPEKQLLQTAAVVGKDFDYRLLLAVAGLPEEKLRQSLMALQAAEFMFETRLFPHPESPSSML